MLTLTETLQNLITMCISIFIFMSQNINTLKSNFGTAEIKFHGL